VNWNTYCLCDQLHPFRPSYAKQSQAADFEKAWVEQKKQTHTLKITRGQTEIPQLS